MTGFDMHFRFAKINVATSVCTGGRNCPPDSSTDMGSSPVPQKKKSPEPIKVDSELLVRMTGFEPAASCSQIAHRTFFKPFRALCGAFVWKSLAL